MRIVWLFMFCFGLVATGGAMPASAAAQSLLGYVDSLNAQSATGWACVPGTGLPVEIAAYAGPSLLGYFPATLARPDLGTLCGDGDAHGFALWFDPPTQAQFLGQTTLSLYAVAGTMMQVLLPPSSAHAFNPAAIPQGSLSGFDSAGSVSGSVNSGTTMPAAVRLYAGGPAGEGGVLWAWEGGTGAAFTIGPEPSGLAGPILGYATDQAGVQIPLQNALPASGAGGPAAKLALSFKAAQSGSRSGITNTVFTSWVAPGLAFGGLAGNLTFSGNHPSFSEALITVGTTGDSQAACLAQNGTWPVAAPALNRLWAAILKNNAGVQYVSAGPSTGQVSVPANFALPFPVNVGGSQGECLMTLMSAGYPYLDSANAKYTATASSLTAWMVPQTLAAPQMIRLGLGGEFRFVTGIVPAPTAFVGIEASEALLVDGIAAAVSASSVLGAPAGSSWLPLPAGPWTMSTSFVVMPAAVCSAQGFPVQPGNGVYSVIRRPTPAPFTTPAGSTTIMNLPVSSKDNVAIQRSAFQAFGMSGLLLNAGDCLIAFHAVQTAASVSHGVLDFENQSTIYLRVRR